MILSLSKSFIRCLSISAILLFSFTQFAPASKAPTSAELVQENLLSEFETVSPGQEFLVGVKFNIRDHWHIYWSNPGESGIPTDIQWSSSTAGVTFSPTLYPIPSWFIYGGIVGFGYGKETILMSRVKIPDTAKPGERIEIKAKTEWLVCNETCIPGGALLSISLKVSGHPLSTKDAVLFQQYGEKPKDGAKLGKLLKLPDGHYDALVVIPFDLEHNNGSFEKIKFFPFTENNGPQNAEIIVKEDAQYSPMMVVAIPITHHQNVASLDLKGILGIDIKDSKGKITKYAYAIDLPLVFTSAAIDQDHLPQSADSNQSLPYPIQIAFMFLLAFAGGIILNIMPCVLPVISLKIISFVQHSQDSKGQTFKLGLWFALGILISMWGLTAATLAVQFAGHQIGWGFQFQSPAYVLAMITLCLLITLNLFGVFEVLFFPTASTMQLAQKSGVSGAFFNGVLAVVLATPCTAPFMGAALGFAFVQPAWVIILIFTAIGLGLATPYVILSAFPSLLKFLPKPGAWMNTAKQFLGFPMLATAIWLIWVFNAQQGRDATTLVLFFLLVVSFGFWIYGKFQVTGKQSGFLIALLITLVGFLTLVIPALKTNPEKPGENTVSSSLKWSPQRVQEALKNGQAVFVDFTADWCLSCKVNERAVLKTEEIQDLFKDKDVLFLIADWTSYNPQITATLKEFGRSGVPLYLYYPPGLSQPVILPEVLTKEILRKTILEK